MKRYGIILCALSSATVLALAACGGGGGGGGGGVVADAPFTNAITLPGPDAGTTVSAATAVNDPVAGTRLEVVGMADDTGAPGVLQPVVWDFAPNAIAVVQVPGTPPAPPTPANGIPAADLVPEDLPGLNAGTFGAAFGNNNVGEIVGQSEDGPIGPVRAVIWSPEPVGGGARTITALDAVNEGAAFGINNNGLAVGERVVAGAPNPVVIDSDTTPAATVGTLSMVAGTFTGTSGSAFSINAANVIVGELTDANGVTKAVVWTPITTTAADRTDYNAPVALKGKTLAPNAPAGTPVPTLNGDSTAVAISGNRVFGEITDTANGMIHAVVWDGIVATTEPQDRGANTNAGGMNAGGRPVGGSAGNAALLGTATPVRLHTAVGSPTANGGANAINNSSKVVGTGNGKAFFATP